MKRIAFQPLSLGAVPAGSAASIWLMPEVCDSRWRKRTLRKPALRSQVFGSQGPTRALIVRP